jgi:hypothetical protein
MSTRSTPIDKACRVSSTVSPTAQQPVPTISLSAGMPPAIGRRERIALARCSQNQYARTALGKQTPAVLLEQRDVRTAVVVHRRQGSGYHAGSNV